MAYKIIFVKKINILNKKIGSHFLHLNIESTNIVYGEFYIFLHHWRVWIWRDSDVNGVVVHFNYDNTGVIKEIPDKDISSLTNFTVNVQPLRAGHVTVTANTSDTGVR